MLTGTEQCNMVIRASTAERTHPKPEEDPEGQVPDASQPQVQLRDLEACRGCTAGSAHRPVSADAQVR